MGAIKEDLIKNQVNAVHDWYRTALEEAFAAERDVAVTAVIRAFEPLISVSNVPMTPSELSAEWLPIESLSMLRQIVGGRFQNLRDRWVKAGFPLKEHRGARVSAKVEVSETGWMELVTWIQSQGFEARRSEETGGALFEVKRIS